MQEKLSASELNRFLGDFSKPYVLCPTHCKRHAEELGESRVACGVWAVVYLGVHKGSQGQESGDFTSKELEQSKVAAEKIFMLN